MGWRFSSEDVEGLEQFAHRALLEATNARQRQEYAFENECLAWSCAAQARRLLLFHRAYTRAVEVNLWAAQMYRNKGQA